MAKVSSIAKTASFGMTANGKKASFMAKVSSIAKTAGYVMKANGNMEQR
jgi:hypothetical protein